MPYHEAYHVGGTRDDTTCTRDEFGHLLSSKPVWDATMLGAAPSLTEKLAFVRLVPTVGGSAHVEKIEYALLDKRRERFA